LEFLTIFLSSLMTLVSPAGVVVDRVAQTTIRKQFESVEQLEVRVDNAPSYQLVQGKADRIRIAGRGLFPAQDIRLEAFELETDPIQLNAARLRRGQPRLEKPLRAGMRLVLKQDDMNRALRSPLVLDQLKALGVNALGQQNRQRAQRYTLLNPRVEVLANQRLRLQAELQEAADPDTLTIVVESGLAIVAGRRLQLLHPLVTLDDKAVPESIMQSIAKGISEQSDLRQLETTGLTARILQLNLTENQITLAAFIQVAPDKPL
jgi:hypothetical protein